MVPFPYLGEKVTKIPWSKFDGRKVVWVLGERGGVEGLLALQVSAGTEASVGLRPMVYLMTINFQMQGFIQRGGGATEMLPFSVCS